jgi:hypothetical protein
VRVVRALWFSKSTSALRPSGRGAPASPPSPPSFGLKLFIDAQASIGAPSTLNCSP